MPVSAARAAAFDILLRVEQQQAYASQLLHSPRCADLSTADHALATELVLGVLRWRSALDAALAQVSSQPLARLDPEVLAALRIGAYQLGWLDRIPARATIHESVELVKRAGKRWAASFANAVLRKLPGVLPRGDQRMQLMRSAATPETLAAAWAHPEWLIARWTSQFGIETTKAICRYDQSVPATAVRLRTAALEGELRRDGIELAPGALLASARRVVSGDVTRTQAFADGRVAIQDEASQLVAALVGNGARILDCCAAPGGKTLAMADRNPNAEVVAVELHPHRARDLRQRLAGSNVRVICADLKEVPVRRGFDRVLADVPCHGTGTLARHPEIKWRLKAEDLADLAMAQRALLDSALKHVRKGGRLIYSTCSLEREQDEAIIEYALHVNRSFHRVDCRTELEQLREQGELREVASLLSGPYVRTIPGRHGCDGFFVAVLARI